MAPREDALNEAHGGGLRETDGKHCVVRGWAQIELGKLGSVTCERGVSEPSSRWSEADNQ